MTGNAYPSLAVAVSNAIGFGLLAAVLVAVSVQLGLMDWRWQRRMLATVIAVIGVLVGAAVITAFIYHASWIDYRRGVR
jgi:hydrogenase/urease accessory protein HupE